MFHNFMFWLPSQSPHASVFIVCCKSFCTGHLYFHGKHGNGYPTLPGEFLTQELNTENKGTITRNNIVLHLEVVTRKWIYSYFVSGVGAVQGWITSKIIY